MVYSVNGIKDSNTGEIIYTIQDTPTGNNDSQSRTITANNPNVTGSGGKYDISIQCTNVATISNFELYMVKDNKNKVFRLPLQKFRFRTVVFLHTLVLLQVPETHLILNQLP